MQSEPGALMAEGDVGPSPDVLDRFGAAGTAVRLAGGQGTSWRVGSKILKPLDGDPQLLAWQAEVLGGLAGRPDFRVAPPLPSRDGAWVVSGWTAYAWEPGRHEPGRWTEIIDVGRRLHDALAATPQHPALAERTDSWATADRVAWAEIPFEARADTKQLADLRAAVRPVAGRSQLVHGDLTGNVLFDGDLAPLIIDFSPYWRPPQFAAAIVVADALVFEGSPASVIDELGPDPDRFQYLVRALIFRLLTDHLRGVQRGSERYQSAVDLAVGSC